MQTDKAHQHFFNHQARSWNSSESRQKIESLEKIFQQIDLEKQDMVLDLGCGTGILVPILLKHLREGGKLIEFDFSLEMLRQNKLQSQAADGLLLRLNGDAHQLPFITGRFTFLVCFAVVPHLSRPLVVYRELSRVLRSGGKLLILHLMGSARLNQFHSQAGKEIRHDHLPPAEKVAGQIAENGFHILQVEEREDLYLILARKQ